jgi:hypothetical protein
LQWFSDHELSPILFTAGGRDFELDDCFVLADPGGDLWKWGEPIAARRPELVDALQHGLIDYLALDTPRADAKSRSDWHANVSANPTFGKCFVGIDQELVADPVVLLRRACDLVQGIFDVRYGFAYTMPLVELPDSYASGSRRFSFADFQEAMRLKRERIPRPISADDLWSDELSGKRRYLVDRFRGAYPANILSESHVRAAGLDHREVGTLTPLDRSLWLWELSDHELPQAETLLAERNLLVRQADRP